MENESSGVARASSDNPLLLTVMKLLFWNVRGVGKPSFLSTFWRIMQQNQLQLCVLMEMRLSSSSLDCIHY